jgi:regulatory protein
MLRRATAARRGSARPPGRAADAEAVREAALRLLERTRRTRADLRRRLAERGYAPAMVEAVLDRLTAVGLLDDVEYARAYLAGRWGRRMAGWRRLEQELRRRGVTAEDVAAARARIGIEVGPVSEVESARRTIAQAARRYSGLEPRLRRRRLYGLLARRGFDGATIEEALGAEDER